MGVCQMKNVTARQLNLGAEHDATDGGTMSSTARSPCHRSCSGTSPLPIWQRCHDMPVTLSSIFNLAGVALGELRKSERQSLVIGHVS